MCTEPQARLLLEWISTDLHLNIYDLEDTEQSYTFLLKATKVLSSKLNTLGAQSLSVEKKKGQSAVPHVCFVPMYSRVRGPNMSKYICFL